MLTLTRPTLVVCSCYPPRVGGSSIVMWNLLSGFSQQSIILATYKPARAIETAVFDRPHARHFVYADRPLLPYRAGRVWKQVQLPLVTRRLARLCRDHKCGAVIGVYPDLFMIDAAQRAAAQAGLPFVSYLHDTIAEATSSSTLARWGSAVQRRVFAASSLVLVLTGGLVDLYERKYGLRPVLVPHSYPEPVVDAESNPPAARQSLFWGGAVYSINSEAVGRVFRAMTKVEGLRLTLASAQSRGELARMGLEGERIDLTCIPAEQRPRYLDLLRQHSVLVLALNWPDETHVHPEELSTIFPTKTPEYLASGRAILVHCPADYHLARFFREHACGEVVDERSTEAVEAALRKMTGSPGYQHELGSRALVAARLFAREQVASTFRDALEHALRHERSALCRAWT